MAVTIVFEDFATQRVEEFTFEWVRATGEYIRIPEEEFIALGLDDDGSYPPGTLASAAETGNWWLRTEQDWYSDFTVRAAQPDPTGERPVNNDEFQVELADGRTLRCPAYPDECDYARVCDGDGQEIAYWHYNEWERAPAEVMGAIVATIGNPHAFGGDGLIEAIAPDVRSLILGRAACGEWPVPQTEAEWLAWILDELEVQVDMLKEGRDYGSEEVSRRAAYAGTLIENALPFLRAGIAPAPLPWEMEKRPGQSLASRTGGQTDA
jgi:hypothetical protein